MLDRKEHEPLVEIQMYNNRQTTVDKEICDLLATTIDS